jgi:hypothetical protein
MYCGPFLLLLIIPDLFFPPPIRATITPQMEIADEIFAFI